MAKHYIEVDSWMIYFPFLLNQSHCSVLYQVLVWKKIIITNMECRIIIFFIFISLDDCVYKPISYTIIRSFRIFSNLLFGSMASGLYISRLSHVAPQTVPGHNPDCVQFRTNSGGSLTTITEIKERKYIIDATWKRVFFISQWQGVQVHFPFDFLFHVSKLVV